MPSTTSIGSRRRIIYEKNGVSVEKVTFVEVPFPKMGDALVHKQIDAAAMVEPFATRLMKTGSVKAVTYPLVEVTPGLDIAGSRGLEEIRE